MLWAFWKPLCCWGCKHTAQSASFPSTQTCLWADLRRALHTLSPADLTELFLLSQSSSAHICVLLDHKGQLKMHIPKGQEWNLLCWAEIWYLPCSWGWRAASLNSFFQVSPLKLPQILALCFYKGVWKQFFWQKMPRLFSATGLMWQKNDEQNYCSHCSELTHTINDLSNISFSDNCDRFLKSSIKGRRREKIVKESNFWQAGAAWGILGQFFFELPAACGYKDNIKHLMIVKEKEKGRKKKATEGARSTVG